MKESKRYTAFISYKHDPNDRAHALDLEKHLKTYALHPWKLPRRIFRDEKHMVPGVDLGQAIKEALDDSKFLLVLASPASKKSTWVQDEIRHWCKVLGRTENLIIVLIAGKIASTKHPLYAKDDILIRVTIDWKKTNALHKGLKEYLPGAPLFVDLRRFPDSKDRTLENPKYKKVVNDIVARFIGIDPNEMLGEEIRAYRHQLRIRNTFIIALTLLFLATITGGYIAFHNWRQVRLKQAVSYLEQAKTMAAQGISQAASMYGAASLSMNNRSLEARIYANELHRVPKLLVELPAMGKAIDALRFVAGSKYLISHSIAGTVALFKFNLSKSTCVREPWRSASKLPKADLFQMSDNGRFMVLSDNRKDTPGSLHYIYEISTTTPNNPRETATVQLSEAANLISISDDGHQIFISTGDKLHWKDVSNQKSATFSQDEGDSFFSITSMQMNWIQGTMALGSAGGNLILWDVPKDDKKLMSSDPFRYAPRATIFTETSPEGYYGIDNLVWRNRDYWELFIAMGTSCKIASISEDDLTFFDARALCQIYDLVGSKDGSFLYAAGKFLPLDTNRRVEAQTGLLGIFHERYMDQIFKRVINPGSGFRAICVSDNGEFLATGTENGKIQIWRLPNYSAKHKIGPFNFTVKKASGSYSNDILFLAGEEGENACYRSVASQNCKTFNLSNVIKVYTPALNKIFHLLKMNPTGVLQIESWSASSLILSNRWEFALLQPMKLYANESIVSVTDDGQMVAIVTEMDKFTIASKDGKVLHITLPANPQLDRKERINWITLSPDGKRLALGTGQRILGAQMPPIGKSTTTFTWETLLEFANEGKKGIFSATGRYLAVSESDLLRVFNIFHGRQMTTIASSYIESFGFTVNENHIYILNNSAWGTLNLNAYEFPDLTNRVEGIDIGLPAGSVVYTEVSEAGSYVGLVPLSSYNDLLMFDIGNFFRALEKVEAEPVRTIRSFRDKYGFDLKEGVVLDTKGKRIPSYF